MGEDTHGNQIGVKIRNYSGLLREGNAMKSTFILSALFLGLCQISAGALDLALGGYGLSLGNSKRITGIRINTTDQQVERVTGLNLTLWNPGQNPAAVYNGASVGLIGVKGRRTNGIALGGLGVNAREQINGIAVGSIGIKAPQVRGLAARVLLVEVEKRTDGLIISPGFALAEEVRGVTIGGLFTAGDSSLTGIALSPGVAFSGRLRGVAIGGIGVVGSGNLHGIAGAGLIAYCERDFDGIACSLGGVGAGERIRGIALGGVTVLAKDVTGVAAGAFNGVIVDRINLEEFLHFRLVNQRFTGLSIGLVNYTRQLRGVQLGLFNYAGNNPRGLRLLPLVNAHL